MRRQEHELRGFQFAGLSFLRATLTVLMACVSVGWPSLANAQGETESESSLPRIRELATTALTQLSSDDLPRALEHAAQGSSPVIRPLLLRVSAIAAARRYPDAGLGDAPPLHWVAANGEGSALHARGGSRPLWLAHEAHILQLSGTRSGAMLFRYPLTGEFEISCEAQHRSSYYTEGGLDYGGLKFLANSGHQMLYVQDADASQMMRKPCPFIRSAQDGIFMDAETKQEKPLLVGEQATLFSSTYWNQGWSHDSRSIVFKARHRATGADDIVVADIDSPRGFKILLASSQGVRPDFSFSPDNKQILFAMHNQEHKGPQLYTIHRDKGGPPQLLPGQPPKWKIKDCDWSPDGKQIAFTGETLPGPREWTRADAATTEK